MAGSVIVAGARTPIGKLSGALASLSAMDLGGIAIKAALERAGVTPDRVKYVFMGQVLLGRPGPEPVARRVGQRRHRHGRADHHDQQGLPVGPQHDLPRRPHDPGRRGRHRRGRRHGVDDPGAALPAGRPRRVQARRRQARRLDDARRAHLLVRPLRDGPGHRALRRRARSAATRRTRSSANSHERAAAAIKDGRFDAEIVNVEIPQRKGDPIIVDTDEGVRPGTTAESLGGLRPAFDKEGTITAGNASQISDGAAAVDRREQGRGRVARRRPARRDPRLRPGRRSRPVAADAAVACDQAGARQDRQEGLRRRPVRAQRSVRRRRPRVDGRPRHHRRDLQRERRRHRPRSPDRRVGHPRRAAPAATS